MDYDVDQLQGRIEELEDEISRLKKEIVAIKAFCVDIDYHKHHDCHDSDDSDDSDDDIQELWTFFRALRDDVREIQSAQKTTNDRISKLVTHIKQLNKSLNTSPN